MKEVDAANLVLGLPSEGDRFVIKWGPLRFRMSMPPITARGIIKISECTAHLPKIDPDGAMFPTLLENGENLHYICKALAISTRTTWVRFFTYVISTCEISQIALLWKMLITRSDPDSFFFIMVSARGTNKMMTLKPETRKAEKPSLADLPS